jgi:hypothetical protein
MKGLETVKGWARELIDLLLVFIVLGVTVQIIFGDVTSGVPYFGNVVENLMALVSQLGNGGIVGLIALLIIIGLYRSGRTA